MHQIRLKRRLMKTNIVNTLPEEKWRNYVDNHPDGNMFHTPEMFHVFSQVKGYYPEIWAALDEDQQVIGLFFPVHITLSDGILHRLTTRTNVFGGILVNRGPDGEKALIDLLKAYQRSSGRRSIFTEIRNMAPIEGYQPLLNHMKFAFEEQLNYIIDLTPSPDQVFERIGKRTRKNIRNGRNKGEVDIVTVEDRAGVMDSYKLLQNSYFHAQVPLSDVSLFTTAFEYLTPKGMIKIRNAMVGDSPAATSIELYYKDLIFGWYGGMDRDYSAYVPNELLMAHILESGSENGYRKYDFGGAGKSDEDYGVRRFKAKFGGDLVNYGRNIWVPSPLIFSVTNFGYGIVQKLNIFNRS